MKNGQDTSSQGAQELLSELQALVAEAEKMLSDSTSEKTAGALSALRARFDAAQERFSDVYSTARETVVASARRTDETIRENPYQAMAVAAGVGLLVGVLLGRRGR